jgi:hypothetical protein
MDIPTQNGNFVQTSFSTSSEKGNIVSWKIEICIIFKRKRMTLYSMKFEFKKGIKLMDNIDPLSQILSRTEKITIGAQ